MELQVTQVGTTKSTSKLEVVDATFSADYNEALVHQVVVSTMNAARQGSKAQKNRSDVRGGGAKPWKQKGTGRARAGTSRSPIWRSGGATFAARPRDFSQKINKKMFRSAIKSILSELVREDRLVLVDSITVENPKTRDLVAVLKGMELRDVLILTDDMTENLFLAARNLYNVGLCNVSEVDPVCLMAYEKVLITAGAVKYFEESLA